MSIATDAALLIEEKGVTAFFKNADYARDCVLNHSEIDQVRFVYPDGSTLTVLIASVVTRSD